MRSDYVNDRLIEETRMSKAKGQLKFAMAMLWFQVVLAGLVVIGSFFKDDTGREVGFCTAFLGVSAAAQINLMQVSNFLKQSPKSDEDQPDAPSD
ncbi:MAG: hypothetical protein ABGZ35_30895 [Planctomycetaceae bacterium]